MAVWGGGRARRFTFGLCLPSPALSCNENDAEHLDRDQPYPSSQKTKRMRTSFKHHQLRTMKSYFAINHNPDAKDLKQLAQKTGLTKRVLQVSRAGATGGGLGGVRTRGTCEVEPHSGCGLREDLPFYVHLSLYLSLFSVSIFSVYLWLYFKPPTPTPALTLRSSLSSSFCPSVFLFCVCGSLCPLCLHSFFSFL